MAITLNKSSSSTVYKVTKTVQYSQSISETYTATKKVKINSDGNKMSIKESDSINNAKPKINKTVYIVFVSLLLDLLAFTMILPLFPSLLDHYRLNDKMDGLYPYLLEKVRYFQHLVGAPDRFNSVLFGGKFDLSLRLLSVF